MRKVKPYSERLPRRIKTDELCRAMDMHGVRCDERATVEHHYHGDSQTEDGEKAPWVITISCDFHGSYSIREIESKLPNKTWFRLHRAGKLMFPSLRRAVDNS